MRLEVLLPFLTNNAKGRKRLLVFIFVSIVDDVTKYFASDILGKSCDIIHAVEAGWLKLIHSRSVPTLEKLFVGGFRQTVDTAPLLWQLAGTVWANNTEF